MFEFDSKRRATISLPEDQYRESEEEEEEDSELSN
jgi:hypothetical protein